MKIVYDDYGGTHSTVVAAALHLGKMSAEGLPGDSELMGLPLFDRVTRSGQGYLVYMGTDNEGHQVYILGRGPSGVVVERALISGCTLAGGLAQCIIFVDTLSCVNLWMRIGGFLSRALGWVSLGRPIVLFGTRRAFPDLVNLVNLTKKRAALHQGCHCTLSSHGQDLAKRTYDSVFEGSSPRQE